MNVSSAANAPAVPTPMTFEEKCAYIKERTGMVIDRDTPFVMSKESTVRLSYWGEFFRTLNNSDAESHPEKMEVLARKYSELKDELEEKYADDENKLFEQMDELNQAFETSLKNTVLIPVNALPAMVYPLTATVGEEATAAVNEEIKRVEEYNARLKKITAAFQDNMLRHVDDFYESFINEIRDKDFDDAFNASMSLLDSGETKSAEEISYRDMLKVMDVMKNTPTEFDSEGRPTKYKYQTADDILNALLDDEGIPDAVKKFIESFKLTV